MRLGVHDVAALLNVSEKTVYRWVRDGKLPAYRVNEQYRFNRAEILEWAASHRVNLSPDLFQEPDDRNLPLPELTQALKAGGVYYRVDGQDKASVLKAVVELLRVPDDVDRGFLLQILLARESLGSTGIGDGIAIPHVRNPIVLQVPHPMISLCFLERPIEFGALDGQPVHTLFTLISPTVRGHLHMLSRLCFALRDPGVKDVLGRQGTRDAIHAEIARVEGALNGTGPTPGGAADSSLTTGARG